MLIFLIFAFLFGASIGSFLNVVILRLPKDESLWRRGSHCFSCDKPIPWYHNIPVVSYLVLRGKCAMCGAPFSPQYFFVELITGTAFTLLCYFRFRGLLPFLPTEPIDYQMILPAAAAYIRDVVLFSSLLVITVIDARELIIPIEITLTTFLMGMIIVYAMPQVYPAPDRLTLTVELFLAALAGGILMWIVRIAGGFVFKREALGLGDVHLMFMLAPFLGWQKILLTIFLASVIGCAGGLLTKALAKGEKKVEIPFGPYLSISAFIAYFWGYLIIDWYWRLLIGK